MGRQRTSEVLLTTVRDAKAAASCAEARSLLPPQLALQALSVPAVSALGKRAKGQDAPLQANGLPTLTARHQTLLHSVRLIG